MGYGQDEAYNQKYPGDGGAHEAVQSLTKN